MIVVEDFHKAYAGTAAVRGVSFAVSGGEVLGLVGPNGAGKTTILRTLIGIIPASRGRLSVDGFDVTDEPLEVKRRLAYVPDDPVLFPDLTVDEHLAFIASAYEVPYAEQKAQQLVEEFELTTKRGERVGDLSRGMRQKLAICCAYLRDPAAMLFDEPMTGLDPHGIRRLKQSIRERAEGGAAVIVSSHLLAMVEDVCTHVLILNDGRTRFCGPIGELKSTFVSDDEQATLEKIYFLATQESPECQSVVMVDG